MHIYRVSKDHSLPYTTKTEISHLLTRYTTEKSSGMLLLQKMPISLRRQSKAGHVHRRCDIALAGFAGRTSKPLVHLLSASFSMQTRWSWYLEVRTTSVGLFVDRVRKR